MQTTVIQIPVHLSSFCLNFSKFGLMCRFFQESITGEGLRLATDRMDSKNFYAINPAFDMKKPNKRR